MAFFAKAKKGKGRDKRGDRDRDRNKKKCTHCNHKGHNVSECRKLKREEEKKEQAKAAIASTPDDSSSSDSTAKAAVARVPTEEVVHLFRATAVEAPPVETAYAGVERVNMTKMDLETSDFQDTWLVDSGASRIMSSRREWFCQYTHLTKPIKVVLRDDSEISAVGIGRILVRMYDGSGGTPLCSKTPYTSQTCMKTYSPCPTSIAAGTKSVSQITGVNS